MHQHLEDGNYLVNQYFSNDRCMLQNHAQVKRFIQSESRSMGFKVIKYKTFIDMVSDSSLQLTFKKLPLVEFLCNIKEYPQLPEQAIKILLLSPSTYCKRLNVE